MEVGELEEHLYKANYSCQNAVKLCEQYQKETKKLLKQTTEDGQKLKTAENLLKSLHDSFSAQSNSLNEIIQILKTNFSTLKIKLKNTLKRKKLIERELHKIIQKMKSQPIDVGLLGKLPPGTSLYHYVDQVSIYSITEPLQKSLNLLSVPSFPSFSFSSLLFLSLLPSLLNSSFYLPLPLLSSSSTRHSIVQFSQLFFRS